MNEKRVLIIDDSPTMRKLLRHSLAKVDGIEMIDASDGMDALRTASTDHIDLALVDLNMPIMDGLTFIRLVRGDATLSDMKLVVVTTEGAEVERAQALDAGADAFLSKPIQTREIRELVEKLLEA